MIPFDDWRIFFRWVGLGTECLTVTEKHELQVSPQSVPQNTRFLVGWNNSIYFGVKYTKVKPIYYRPFMGDLPMSLYLCTISSPTPILVTTRRSPRTLIPSTASGVSTDKTAANSQVPRDSPLVCFGWMLPFVCCCSPLLEKCGPSSFGWFLMTVFFARDSVTDQRISLYSLN